MLEDVVVSLSAADNCLAPKTGYNAPLSSHCEGAFCHDSTSILLSARGLRTPVAVCHAAPRLAQPRRDDPDKASQAPHAAPPALHRAHTVCGPDAHAPLCPVCARSRTSPSAPSRTTRPHAPDPPASPHGGHRAALLSPYGLEVSRLVGPGEPPRQRPSQWRTVATLPVYLVRGFFRGASRHALPWQARGCGVDRARAGVRGGGRGYACHRAGL